MIWSGSMFTMWSKAVGWPPARLSCRRRPQRPVQFEITEQTFYANSARESNSRPWSSRNSFLTYFVL